MVKACSHLLANVTVVHGRVLKCLIIVHAATASPVPPCNDYGKRATFNLSRAGCSLTIQRQDHLEIPAAVPYRCGLRSAQSIASLGEGVDLPKV